MREIRLTIPEIDQDQNIEIDVRINGKTNSLKYRIEIVHWVGCDTSSEEKVKVIRHAIEDHNKDWELIEIGNPEINKVPLVFKKKKSVD